MPGLFSWYNSQYSSWNRMRRMQAPQFVARIDSRTSRNATAMHNGTDIVNANTNGNDLTAGNTGDVVINMGDLNLNSSTSPSNKENKDTLFGPSIGVVNTAPEWCAVDAALDEKLLKSEKKLDSDEKSYVDESDEDELTPEIVKEWVRRSKEPSQPTTTLQALVNLKRPSIRLSPLAAPGHDTSPSASSLSESPDSHGKLHQQHGLEFEFDCDASQCFISLHVFGVPSSLGESDELNAPFPTNDLGKENERLVLFETTLPGGFARKLTLGDGAVLELARLEAAAKAHRAQQAAAAATASAAGNNGGNKENTESATANASASGGNTDGHERHRKRLTFFRKRGNAHRRASNSHAQSGQAQAPAPTVPAGPALAVVDAEAPHANPNAPISPQNQSTLATFFAGGEVERLKRKKESEEEGVRIAIRIAARDADGQPMKVRNEQVTYLHIVRQGPPPSSTVAGPSTSSSANGESATTGVANASEEQAHKDGEAKEEAKDEEDNRPWVVRVVKREARIGAHAFQLHEIYGLTAHATASDSAAHHVTPSSPTSSPEQHTYPPIPGQPHTASNGGGTDTDDSPAECLLCLSAAREVVLLPCRHLVACRECAVNMVEFGAGGTVVQPEADVPNAVGGDATTGAENANDGVQGDANTNAPTAPTPAAPTPTPATRRKRKAKGWFCPVCRQPYTSLLRITTSPPPGKGSGLGHTNTDSTHADAKRVSLTSSLDAEADPTPEQQQQQALAHPLATVVESGVATLAAPQTTAVTAANTNASSGNVSAEVGAEGNPRSNANGANANGMESRGGLASLTRPAFLTRFSGRARDRDLERGA